MIVVVVAAEQVIQGRFGFLPRDGKADALARILRGFFKVFVGVTNHGSFAVPAFGNMRNYGDHGTRILFVLGEFLQIRQPHAGVVQMP